MRSCEQCKEHFEPTTRSVHRFCSSACRNRYHNLRKVTGPRQDRVPVGPVRDVVVAAIAAQHADFAASRSSIIETREKLTYNRISICLWGSRAGRPGLGDTTHLKRALGLMPHSDHPYYGTGRYAKTINAKLAARIVRHVGGNLHKAGL